MPITLEGDELEDVTRFGQLCSIVDKQGRGWGGGGGGGTDTSIKERIGRARAAFLQMKNIWASPNLIINIKITIFNTTVKLVLLYGAETWRITAATLKKIHTIINTWLRRIFRIRWSATINGPSSNQQKMKSSKNAGDGLDTPPESQ